ncbi:hypothetical protein [Henriciella sp.]|uniref:hypothetical protein n=1 Tax=Henriciella sp. TaxID=1968823 RepID=UPI003C780B9D
MQGHIFLFRAALVSRKFGSLIARRHAADTSIENRFSRKIDEADIQRLRQTMELDRSDEQSVSLKMPDVR